MRFPRQASMASRSPLSPLPSNPPASHKQLVRTKQVAAKETWKGNASNVDLGTCTPAPTMSEAGAETSDGSTRAPANICRRNDGRAWRCKNAATGGSTLCEHHLARYVARASHAAASGAKGSRCPRAGGYARGDAASNDTITKKKRTATKSQKYAEKESEHEAENVMAVDPEIYNAACILYHYIAGFWFESAYVSNAADATLVEEMKSGDDDDDKEDAVVGGDQHGHEGFLASDDMVLSLGV